MAWTYDPNLTTERDLLRLLSGDKNADYPLYTDEEMDEFLAEHGSAFKAVGWIFRNLAGDPDRLNIMRDATGGSVTLATLMRSYAEMGNRWLA